MPEIATPALAKIDSTRIVTVQATQRRRQRALARWDEDQMYVVGHQAVGERFHALAPALHRELGEVVGVVLRVEEHLLATIAALSNVMGNPGRNRPCQTSHGGT